MADKGNDDTKLITRLGKMRLRVGLALVVMLAMALGRIKQEQEDALRWLVRAA